jgi:UDP-glucose:(heptosyl)LPS alpha-1,3-glucosyltransferase
MKTMALVLHDFHPGYGQGRYAYEIVRRLQENFSLAVYADRFPEGTLNLKHDLFSKTIFYKVQCTHKNLLAKVYSFMVHAEFLLRQQPQTIIHAQGLTSWSADLSTIHICSAARERADPSIRYKDRIFRRAMIPLERKFYQQKRLQYIIGCSHRSVADIRHHYQYAKGSSVIYHGTDLEKFKPLTHEDKIKRRKELKLPEKEWIWLFVGEATKGLKQTIDALQQDPYAHLAVVTRSDETVYKNQAQRLRVHNRIHWLGSFSDTSLIYPCADIFVYPSAYDTFAMVVAEAMASGLPVVVGENVGVAEWIQSYHQGIRIDPQSTRSIAESSRYLANHPSEVARMSLLARSALQSHSWDTCAYATGKIYESFLSENT